MKLCQIAEVLSDWHVLLGSTQLRMHWGILDSTARLAMGDLASLDTLRRGPMRFTTVAAPHAPRLVGRAPSGHDARGPAGCTIKERRGNGARTRRSSLAAGPTTSSARLDSRW